MLYPNSKITPDNAITFNFEIEITEKDFNNLRNNFSPKNMDEGKWEIENKGYWVYFIRSWSKVEIYKCLLNNLDNKFSISEIQINPQYVTVEDFSFDKFKQSIFQILKINK